MSAISLILLGTAATAAVLGGAALHTARGLRGQLTALRAQLDAQHDIQCGEAAQRRADAERPATRLAAQSAATAAGSRAAATPAAAAGAVPHAREGDGPVTAAEIRTAVAEALADERERELAEARAFWAAQEAREGEPESGSLLAGHGTEYEVAPGVLADHLDALLDLDHGADAGEIFIPRQNGPERGEYAPADESGPESEGAPEPPGASGTSRTSGAEALPGTGSPAETEPLPGTGALPEAGPLPEAGALPEAGTGAPRAEPPDLAAARRRHPSHPDYNLSGEPVIPSPAPSTAPTVADHERTVERLAELALARTPLADVRPGPLGTLDVYVFEDGTTVCLSPGHRATSEALGEALRRGRPPVLMGGSGIAGSFALTFGFPNGDTAYLLADRVIASL
ncbi:hypothetical protein [Streptomyces axinellae]|uniref:Secreted protein n=1 Tax=Streptomyces axinellae TaxID=552788 RepID=A0ABP6CNS6_9ACTN